MSDFYNEVKNIFISPYFGKKYALMSLFLLLNAVAYNLFVCPINLVAGGASGVGVLFNFLFNMEPALVVFLVSFLMFVIALLFLDAEQVVCTLFCAFVYPLFIKATSGLVDIFLIDTSHVLIIVLFGAILTGVGQGNIFKIGLNIGGLSVISKVAYKYAKISVTFVNAVINSTLVIIGGLFLGIDMVLYAIVYIFVLRFVSEKVILGISSNKTFQIVSTKYEKIEKFIHEELGHDVTIYDTYGAYAKGDRKMIMSVVPTGDFTILEDFVKSVDKKAFIFVTDTYEASGQDVAIGRKMGAR